MSPITRKTRNVLVVVAVLLAAGLAALYLVDLRKPPATPTDFVPTSWEAARGTPMHAAHIGKGKVACTECHANGFSEKPKEESCVRCHEGEAKRAHHGNDRSPTTCLSCHTFAAGKHAPACVDCHAKAKDTAAANDPARAAHDLARHVSRDAACNACHAVHGEKGKTRAVLPDCTACHTNVSAQHGAASAAHVESDDAGTDSFDAAVERFAMDARAAWSLREGGVAPASVAGGAHSTGAMCTACHAPHTDAARAKDACAKCHVDGSSTPPGTPHVAPRGRKVAGHEACTTCHQPHDARKADVRACIACHLDRRNALATGKHTACTTCHAPHAPAEARGSCKSCHESKHALAEARVPAHAACESCHDPHRPEAAPAQACARCHASVSPKHPALATSTGAASACVGCHAPHSGGAPSAAHPAAAAACSSCHTKAKDENAFHAAGGKTACTTCHTPHAFATAVTGAAACARCHAAEAKKVEPRTGHAACKSCHSDAHAPTKKAACSTCHGRELATAPRGHATCTSCHDGHSGSLGTHAECTSCHTNKTPAAKALHASLPNGCGSCHRPHGPKGVASPPACTTCHTPDKTSGLHAVSAHAASCASCHTSHGPPRSDRATCTTSCHADRKNHQPEAQVCKGCHMFKR